MEKTVKSRIVLSITSLICVIAICIIANKGIPSLYESHRKKAIAEEAANRVVEQIDKPTTTTAAPITTQPTTQTTTETTVTEDANVYDITEEPTTEEPTTEEEYIEEETTQPDNSSDSEGSFLDKIVSFLTSLFEAITSGDFLSKIKEFFSGIFGGFGISF